MKEDSSTDYSEPGSTYFRSNNDNNSSKSVNSVSTFVEDSSFFGAFESELASNGLGNGAAVDQKKIRGTERHFKNLLVRTL